MPIPWKTMLKASQPPDEDSQQVVWFWYMLTAAVVFLYVWTLVNKPDMRQPGTLVLFTALMLVHLGLHWAVITLNLSTRTAVIVLLVQSGLVFTLVSMSAAEALAIGLYMSLIGEALGFLRISRAGVGMTLYLLLLSGVNFGLLLGWGQLPFWALMVLPLAVFVSVYVTLYSRQAEARERAQKLAAELEQANRQLSDYAAQIEDLTLSSERQRMARELHDTLAQGLAGLILQLEAVDTHLAGGRTDRAQTIVQQAMERARGTLRDARRVIDDLRSGRPASEDLARELTAEAHRLETSLGIPCAVQMDVPEDLSREAGEALRRVVSEGLTNIARHAGAAHAWVQVSNADGRLCVEVRDDGRGFDPAGVAAGHYGLLGLQERARLLGGECRVQSAPGQGTLLRWCIPVDTEAAP
ncbi:signal transduction histidine kinase [Levilinea saccharolytica]|nr:signal transduction histidine kinase [Levilinea saccharolytica]